MVKWNIELLTGVSDIDEHHKHLVKLLNDAYEGFLVGINIEEFHVDELYNLMFSSFDCEESWMINTSYPDISNHRAEHQLFTARFIEIRKHYTQDANNSVEILIFLNNYVNHHIREADKKLGSFVDGVRLKTMADKEEAFLQVPDSADGADGTNNWQPVQSFWNAILAPDSESIKTQHLFP